MKSQLTAKDLLHRLDVQYSRVMSTAVIPEASVGMMAYEVDHYQDGSDKGVRRIDALVLFRDKRWGIEIKVSKSDLVKELSDPTKAAAWAKYVHAFYFFVTPDLIEFAKANVPPQYGILSTDVVRTWKRWGGGIAEYTDHGVAHVRRAKKNSDPLPLTNGTIRRMAMSHMKLRREVEDLRSHLAQRSVTPSPPASPFGS